MQGFQAIEAANGFLISAMGISIVFSALILLSLFISGLPRLIDAIDKNLLKKNGKDAAAGEGLPPAPDSCPVEPLGPQSARLPRDQWEVCNYLRWISERLSQPFSLIVLLDQAEKRGVHRPHYHLDLCLQRELIVESPDQKGLHVWNREIEMTCES